MSSKTIKGNVIYVLVTTLMSLAKEVNNEPTQSILEHNG